MILQKYWSTILVIILWVLSNVYTSNQYNVLKDKNIALDTEIKRLNILVDINNKAYDSIESKNIKIVDRIKIIKQKEYVQIKAVDTMSISVLQGYFSDRYSKR